MRQLLSNTETTTTSLCQNNLTTDLCVPCNIHIHNTTTANAPHIELDSDFLGHIETEQQRTWRWLWCTCCSKQHMTYSEAVQRVSSVERTLAVSHTPEEESAFLLDCDELGITWGSDTEN